MIWPWYCGNDLAMMMNWNDHKMTVLKGSFNLWDRFLAYYKSDWSFWESNISSWRHIRKTINVIPQQHITWQKSLNVKNTPLKTSEMIIIRITASFKFRNVLFHNVWKLHFLYRYITSKTWLFYLHLLFY